MKRNFSRILVVSLSIAYLGCTKPGGGMGACDTGINIERLKTTFINMPAETKFRMTVASFYTYFGSPDLDLRNRFPQKIYDEPGKNDFVNSFTAITQQGCDTVTTADGRKLAIQFVSPNTMIAQSDFPDIGTMRWTLDVTEPRALRIQTDMTRSSDGFAFRENKYYRWNLSREIGPKEPVKLAMFIYFTPDLPIPDDVQKDIDDALAQNKTEVSVDTAVLKNWNQAAADFAARAGYQGEAKVDLDGPVKKHFELDPNNAKDSAVCALSVSSKQLRAVVQKNNPDGSVETVRFGFTGFSGAPQSLSVLPGTSQPVEYRVQNGQAGAQPLTAWSMNDTTQCSIEVKPDSDADRLNVSLNCHGLGQKFETHNDQGQRFEPVLVGDPEPMSVNGQLKCFVNHRK